MWSFGLLIVLAIVIVIVAIVGGMRLNLYLYSRKALPIRKRVWSS